MIRKLQRIYNRIFRKRNTSLSFKRRRRKIQKDIFTTIGIWIIELSLVIGLAYLCVLSLGKQVVCGNTSMAPTINSGDVLLIDSVRYKYSDPNPNDIIAFKPYSNVNASYSIKRVIAVPGDKVLISNGRLYVNGQLFNDIIKTELIKDAGVVSSEVVLGSDEYFVLGDNRNVSEDSRYETIGMVSKEDILGKVWFTFSKNK